MSSTSAMAAKQSIFDSLATYAKEHHASVNAAYSTYYSPGISTRPSLDSKTSTSSQASSSKSTSTMSKTWTSIKKHAKEHHESINGAYALYYGAGASIPASAGMERIKSRESFATGGSEESGKSTKSMRKSWEKVKRHAKEHHRSVNAAYGAYYGGSAVRASRYQEK